MMRYDKATLSCRKTRSGKIGSLAQYDSTSRKSMISTTPAPNSEKIRGCVQEIFWPPISSGSISARIPPPNNEAPSPSILARRLLKVVLSSAFLAVVEVLGSKTRQKSAAIRKIGAWPKNDLCCVSYESKELHMSLGTYHLHPIVSANHPPRGPPALRPTVAITFM